MNFLVPVKIGQKPFRTSNNSANNRKQVVLVWFVQVHNNGLFVCRPFSVIFNSKPTNQVIRYEHEEQVSAKIMLEQKADVLKFVSN